MTLRAGVTDTSTGPHASGDTRRIVGCSALERVVPWGRSFDEYRRMFALTDADLRRRSSDARMGLASFQRRGSAARGHSVISCDPIYRFSTHQIRQRIRDTTEVILSRPAAISMSSSGPPFARSRSSREIRTSSMDTFLNDSPTPAGGKHRYVVAELPALPFGNATFHVANRSHLLFLYLRTCWVRGFPRLGGLRDDPRGR